MFKFLLDTNVFVDALAKREPYYESARLLLALGSLGEFELWISSTQATDIFYILSEGGSAKRLEWAKTQMTELRTYVHACSFTEEDIDNALASTWKDFEDACINQVAHKIKPDVIVTGNTKDFVLSDYPVFNCNDLFSWLEQKHGITYEEIQLS